MTEQYVVLLSNVMVMAMKITIFVVGYLTVRLGYNLLLAGVKGEFKFSAKIGGSKADLVSVSPGLLFVLLGVLLVGYALTVDKEYYMKKSIPVVDRIPAEMIPDAPVSLDDLISSSDSDSNITGKQ